MSTYDWIYKRNRGIHLTIRDIDCEGFDVEKMIRSFLDMNVTFFSFFAAGYVSTYPSDLEFQRISPWLAGRDLTGEIISLSHKYGIKAVPMIDLGQLPRHGFDAHPEWASVDGNGNPREVVRGELYRSCLLSGYVQEYCAEIVRELSSRYELDAMKFGGGSYGFGGAVCYCEACTQQYWNDNNKRLPTETDWSQRDWIEYVQWKFVKTADTVAHLVKTVQEIVPGLPVVGNAVCFGDAEWTMRAALDIEKLAEIEQIIQVETQLRLLYNSTGETGYWQSIRWPSETARYITAVSDKPAWTVASYFTAWPWRRVAAPVHEQQVYLAQMLANGASPMVNLSGGPPAVHEDKSGFSVIKEYYSLMAEHEALFDKDTPLTDIAIVYSQESLVYYGKDNPEKRYTDEIRGFELALDYAHIPYDIISCRVITEEKLQQYKTLVLPSAPVLSKREIDLLTTFVKNGGNLIASYLTGAYTKNGRRHLSGLLDKLLGIDKNEEEIGFDASKDYMTQAYVSLQTNTPISQSINEPLLLPVLGNFIPVRPKSETLVPAKTRPSFRVFPEGWAYTTETAPSFPAIILNQNRRGGQTAFFSFQVGKSFFVNRHPTLSKLIADTVLWTHDRTLPVTISAPTTIQLSVRKTQDNTLAVHLINFSGGERFLQEIIPVRNITVSLDRTQYGRIKKARQIRKQKDLEISIEDTKLTVTVPKIEEYEIIHFS